MREAKPVVFVVDDDQDVLAVVATMLAEEPYEVKTYRSGLEAEKAIAKTAPDFMLVDLMMEEIDAGADLVGKVRAHGVNVPIYMLSSVGDELNRSVDQQQLGLDGIIQKPIDKKNLLAILRARLGKAV